MSQRLREEILNAMKGFFMGTGREPTEVWLNRPQTEDVLGEARVGEPLPGQLFGMVPHWDARQFELR